MSAFDPLPSEVIVHIYTQLGIPDRLALARVSETLASSRMVETRVI
jgi:hypothetical protein